MHNAQCTMYWTKIYDFFNRRRPLIYVDAVMKQKVVTCPSLIIQYTVPYKINYILARG